MMKLLIFKGMWLLVVSFKLVPIFKRFIIVYYENYDTESKKLKRKMLVQIIVSLNSVLFLYRFVIVTKSVVLFMYRDNIIYGIKEGGFYA